MALQKVLAEVIGERKKSDVAEQIGRDPSQLSRWLSGDWRPSSEVLGELLRVCGATPDQERRAWEAFGTPPAVLATPEEIAARRLRLAQAVPCSP